MKHLKLSCTLNKLNTINNKVQICDCWILYCFRSIFIPDKLLGFILTFGYVMVTLRQISCQIHKLIRKALAMWPWILKLLLCPICLTNFHKLNDQMLQNHVPHFVPNGQFLRPTHPLYVTFFWYCLGMLNFVHCKARS